MFEDCTNTIIRQVDEMKNLAGEFSQFARMPDAKPVPTDLNQTVDQVERTNIGGKGHDFEVAGIQYGLSDKGYQGADGGSDN